jgi:hypothetical protein
MNTNNHECLGSDPVERISDNGSVTPGQVRAEVAMGHVLAEHSGAVICGHKVDSVHEIDASTPYPDRALLEFEGEYFERPNAFYSEDKPLDPKFLVRLSAPHPPNTSEVPVFMISGVSGTRTGVMLNSNSYIGGKPAQPKALGGESRHSLLQDRQRSSCG